jgi:hypothetical protein
MTPCHPPLLLLSVTGNENSEMKAVVLLFGLAIAGCCSTDRGQSWLVGDFKPEHGTDSFDLQLSRDGSYLELNFLVKVQTARGVVSVDGLGPVDSGTWNYSKGVLTLHTNRLGHSDRRFCAVRDGDSVTITQLGETKVKFRMRNKVTPSLPKLDQRLQRRGNATIHRAFADSGRLGFRRGNSR